MISWLLPLVFILLALFLVFTLILVLGSDNENLKVAAGLLAALSFLCYVSSNGGTASGRGDETAYKLGTGQEVKDDITGALVLGIDLGTTSSCVAVYVNGKVKIIPNEYGNRATPSYVAFTNKGERLIGESAKRQHRYNPSNTVFNVKRMMGRDANDEHLQINMKYWPFRVVPKDITEQFSRPYVNFKVNNKNRQFVPEQISAMILRQLKEMAEEHLGQQVRYAVVTVPANFNNAQRQATKDAGTIAGLKVLRLINEPTASAIAYGLNFDKDSEKLVLVLDLGGGTFDVSLLSIVEGMSEVLATAGNVNVGGEDLNQRLIKYVIRKTGMSIIGDKTAEAELREEVEQAKLALSEVKSTTITLTVEGESFVVPLSRAKFDQLCSDIFESIKDLFRRVLHDTEHAVEDVHDIILVGGSTKVPFIRTLIKNYFYGLEPLTSSINPEEAIAYGAALYGSVLAESGPRDILLVDVCPLTLGYEVSNGHLAVVIKRNTVIPAKKSSTVTTTADAQDSILIQVYEGEHKMARENHLIGLLELAGIKPAPQGEPKINITYAIDSDGILKITAFDEKSDTWNQLKVTNDRLSLSPSEIQAMRREEENHKTSTRNRVVDDKRVEHEIKRMEEEYLRLESQITGPVLAIDLGSTYISIAVCIDGKFDPIQSDMGSPLHPSFIAFPGDGTVLIGDHAEQQLTSNPENAVFNIKQLLGKSYDDLSKVPDLKYMPFKVKAKANKPHILTKVNKAISLLFSHEEMLAMILNKVRLRAEHHINQEISHAVITVPQSFNSRQRQAVIDSATIAGLGVVRLVGDSVATALSYSHIQNSRSMAQYILVVDIGGAYTDVSVLIVGKEVIQGMATGELLRLGGEDFNLPVIKHYILRIRQKNPGVDVRNDPKALQKLRREVERGKRALSSADNVTLEIPNLIRGEDFRETLTRKKFCELNNVNFRTIATGIRSVLEDAGLAKKQINEILLVGGSSNIPKLRDMIKKFFKDKELFDEIDRQFAGLHGAALLAQTYSEKQPNNIQQQGSIIILDALSKPIILGSITLFERGSAVPAKVSQTFRVRISTGGWAVVSLYGEDNTVARFNFSGLIKTAAEDATIEAVFEVNANSILQVISAKQIQAGKDEYLKVTPTSDLHLTPADIEKMRSRAERLEVMQLKPAEKAKTLQDLEEFIYTAMHHITEHKDLITRKERITAESSIEKVISWLDANADADTEEMKVKKNLLEEAVLPILNKIYQGKDHLDVTTEDIIHEVRDEL